MKTTIYNYLDLVKRKPGMYIGYNKINVLFFHLSGYFAALYHKNIKEEEYPPFDLFHEYVGIKCGWESIGGAGWSTILEEEYGEGKEALDKFFEYLEDFKKEFGNMEKEKIIEYFAKKGYDVKSRFE